MFIHKPEAYKGPIENIIRYDGNQWQRKELTNGGSMVLTSRGLELLSFNSPMQTLLQRYKEEVAQVRQGQFLPAVDAVARRFFRSGGNSSLYKVGDSEVLIKEGKRAGRPSLWESLDRMDYLYGICMGYLDPDVRVPDHYGLYTPPDPTEPEYLMMRKINNGVTVEDVARKRVSLPDQLKDQVEQDFSSLKTRVRAVIQKVQQFQQIPYRNLLPDWTDANVLVDFTTHTRTRSYTLWIIDQ